MNKFLKFGFEDWVRKLKFSHIVSLLFILGFTAYANAIPHPFIHDDVFCIQNNPRLGDWSNLFSYFIQPFLLHNFVSSINAYYRPLLEIVYKIEYLLFKTNPYGYHLFNIVLHILNSILAYATILRLFDKKILAFCAAVLFLLHPVQTEAVSCIAGISNLLFAFFCFTSFFLYIKATGTDQNRWSLLSFTLCLIAYTIALFIKEQSVVFIFLVFFYEIYLVPSSQKFRAIKYLRLLGILAISSGYFLFRKLAVGAASMEFLGTLPELKLRILLIPKTVLTYLQILILPVHLHYYRCLNILQPYILPTILLVVLVIATIYVVKTMPKHDQRVVIFGFGWFVLTILPVLNVVPLIVEYSYIMTSEHFLYFPLFGFALSTLVIANNYIKAFFEERAGQFATLSFLFLCFIFVVVTIRQNTCWRGEIPLFERTLAFEPHLGRIHLLLAKGYYANREFDQAIAEDLTTLNIMEEYLAKTQDTNVRKIYLGFVKGVHFDLAHCYEAKSDFDKAIREYTEALRIDNKDPIIYNNLAVAYLQLNKTNEAIEHFKKAIECDPKNIMAMSNLAICYIQKGNPDKAELFFKKILNINPNFSPARYNLEQLLKSKSVK